MSGVGAGPVATAAAGESGEYTVTLLVPNNKVGGLIGHKGAVISEFRTKSGAYVGVAKQTDMHVGSMDRVIIANGTFEQVPSTLLLRCRA